jgi:hypothetical protein
MKKFIFLVLAWFLVNQAVLPQYNTNLGLDAGEGGNFNVSVGDYAGNHVQGRNNVSVGFSSGSLLRIGNNNTYVGSRTGLNNHNGNNNSFFGTQAGLHSNSSFCTFMGIVAGFNNVADSNTFIGAQAGYNNTTGNKNIFIGESAGIKNTEGDGNIYIGNEACSFSTSSTHNSVLGTRIGIEGDFNSCVIIGFEAAKHNQLGFNNVIIGSKAASFNELYSEGNTLIGAESGYHLTGASGGSNTFLGYKTGFQSLGVVNNTFIGSYAGYNNQIGSSNVYIGFESGRHNLGSANVFIGQNAGSNNAEGNRNTFLGIYSGQNCQGEGNVFIGYGAGRNVLASNRLYIANSEEGNPLIYGDFDQENVALGATDAMGYRLYVNGPLYSVGAMSPSDIRFKENIEPISEPLDKIRNLKGQIFTYSQSEKFKDKMFNQGINYGFIAQDVIQVIPELVGEDPDGYYCLNYDGFIPVLVEALKELDSQFNQQINLLNTQIAELQQQLDQQAVTSKSGSIDGGSLFGTTSALYQNVPNPFNEETHLQYYVSDGSTDAAVYVYDLQGKQQLAYKNLNSGNGEVIIHAGELSPGLYNYCLIADNSIIAIKKMVVTE